MQSKKIKTGPKHLYAYRNGKWGTVLPAIVIETGVKPESRWSGSTQTIKVLLPYRNGTGRHPFQMLAEERSAYLGTWQQEQLNKKGELRHYMEHIRWEQAAGYITTCAPRDIIMPWAEYLAERYTKQQRAYREGVQEAARREAALLKAAEWRTVEDRLKHALKRIGVETVRYTDKDTENLFELRVPDYRALDSVWSHNKRGELRFTLEQATLLTLVLEDLKEDSWQLADLRA